MPHSSLARPFIFYVATLLFFAVGGMTSIGMRWYATLATPSWTPPDLLVATIWCVLFLCSAFSVSLFWEAREQNADAFKATLALYMGNALLVLLWNFLFFGVHELFAAFWVAIAVGGTVLALVLTLWNQVRAAALLLLPYLAWMLFALVLTYAVMTLNP